MSAAPKLLPDPSPIAVADGERFIRHTVILRDFPDECRPSLREFWDAIIGEDFDNRSILPDRLTDLVLSQLTGMEPRTVQLAAYYAEIGAAACHELFASIRPLRRATAGLEELAGKPEPTDADRARIAELEEEAAALRGKLAGFRSARANFKADLAAATRTMLDLAGKPEPTDADRARIAELEAERARLRAELIRPDSLIFRHSGPGFDGRRRIEIIARLKGGKPQDPAREAKAEARAAKKRATVAGGTNGVTAPIWAPEEIAAAQAKIARAAETPEATPEEEAKAREDLDRIRREAKDAAARVARRRRGASPRIELDPPPRPPGDPVLSIQAALEARRKALGIAGNPDPPDDS